jgi:hypothetical protein
MYLGTSKKSQFGIGSELMSAALRLGVLTTFPSSSRNAIPSTAASGVPRRIASSASYVVISPSPMTTTSAGVLARKSS